MPRPTNDGDNCPLYPPIEPYDSGFLKVSPLHTVYYEQCGNPESDQLVLFLHGGPGGAVEPRHRRYFDPQRYRVVLFDQRGCGRSTPTAEVRENDTWALIEDVLRLRQHLGIASSEHKMLLFGGSWGVALALALAQTHPDIVRAIVLRGVFVLRRREIEWLYQHGANMVFPEAFQTYRDEIPEENGERRDLLSAYHRRLFSEDPAVRRSAAKAWSSWEGATSHLVQDRAAIEHYAEDEFADAFARLECHYFVNGGFFAEDGWLLRRDNCARIAHLPVTIVQGRYDMVCPIETAHLLCERLPRAELWIVEDAGHSAFEPGIERLLVRAADRYRRGGGGGGGDAAP